MSKVKIGVIGAGWWATANHIPELMKRDDVELVAVCRLGVELLEMIKTDFGFAFATEDYRELLEQDLDGVIVSTPHYLHFEHAKAALEKGCHVMIEKPMTLDKDEAWELVDIAEKKNLHLLLPYGWNYKAFVQEAKRYLDMGLLGEVEYALCHMASPTRDFFSGSGGIGEMPEEWAETLSEPDPATWQVRENGGGYAHGQITHSSGLLFWLTGLRAKEVTARMTAPNSDVDLYDAATVVFDNGAIGVISGSGTIPAGHPYQVDIRIFGTGGMLVLDVEGNRERVALYTNDGKTYTQDVPSGQGEYSCEAPPNRFIDLIQGKGTNDSSGVVGASTVELITAMFRSAEGGGKPVSI